MNKEKSIFCPLLILSIESMSAKEVFIYTSKRKKKRKLKKEYWKRIKL